MKIPRTGLITLKILLWLAAAIIVIPTTGLGIIGGMLASKGKLSIGTVSGAEGHGPKFGRKTKHRKGLKPGRVMASARIQDLCKSRTTNAAGVRHILAELQEEGAPGLNIDEATLSVVFVPKIVSDVIGSSAADMGGAMIVSGNKGVMLLRGQSSVAGSSLYHEAVHFAQFVETDQGQLHRMDSLWRADSRHPFWSGDVWDGWESITLLAGWKNDKNLVDEVGDSITHVWKKGIENKVAKTPMVLMRNTLVRVLQMERYTPLRDRLDLISRVRRGIAGDVGDLTWADELNRLLVFETEASSMASWCRGQSMSAKINGAEKSGHKSKPWAAIPKRQGAGRSGGGTWSSAIPNDIF